MKILILGSGQVGTAVAQNLVEIPNHDVTIIDNDPEALRKSLKLSGVGQATVIATRVDGRHRAIVCRRLPANLEGSSPPMTRLRLPQ